MKKSEFLSTAQAVTIHVGPQSLVALPKKFSTGSVGFFLNGKVPITLPNGQTVTVQVSASLTVIGSKGWAE